MKLKFIFFISIIYLSISLNSLASENWILDKKLSTISFELPVLLVDNIIGSFSEIEGLIKIDTNKNLNKAIFSVNIDSIDINYNKYKSLILSPIFFNSNKFPIAIIDTKMFSYNNKDKLEIDAELTIKGITHKVPLQLEILYLTEELIQIKGRLKILRNSYNIGEGKWQSTAILRNKTSIEVNLFLFKK